jgi:protein-tyrosine phosphatase
VACFVDIHSHVVPSGDDGAQSLAHGRDLCAEAFGHGTSVLFATPHVWPRLPLTAERERAVRAAHDVLRGQVPLELRLGFELTPTRALLQEDPRRYELEGTNVALLDTPFVEPLDLLFALAEHVEEEGLRPVLAHPERAAAVELEREVLEDFVSRGWLLQVNATSLLGYHGPAAEELGWWLIDSRLAALVASDGHRTARPARLDRAFAVVQARVGDGAVALFDGSALGVTAASVEPTRSRAASRGA